jgi:uncharacterized protein (TIGR03790 family)
VTGPDLSTPPAPPIIKGVHGRLAILLLALALPAGGQSWTPDGGHVLLIVNRLSVESQEIAAYYQRKRRIPESNVCEIEAPTDEPVARSIFEDAIAAPVAHCLESRGLARQVLYLVTTLGVPLKIPGSSGPNGEAASVDSELTLLYQRIREGRRAPLAGGVPNPYFRRVRQPFQHPDFPIYLVTRLAAYSVAEVRAMIDRSLAARNRGFFVVDMRDGSDLEGENWLRDAALFLPEERVIFDQSRQVLTGQREVIGYASWGSNDGERLRQGIRWLGFEWLPGAIMTEYVSSNARTFARPPDDWTIAPFGDRSTYFGGSPQSLIADYIHEGATGASGAVYEPYLNRNPRPDLLFQAYYSGRNLAESYWASIPVLSWMNVVVGDPLCRIGPPPGTPAPLVP